MKQALAFTPERLAAPLALGLFLAYALTMVPALSWRDGPEFAVTATNLGVAHPSGYPLYSLLGRAAAFLPLGSIPLRLSLFSACAAALSVGFIVRLVAREASRLGLASGSAGTLAALAAGLLLGFSPSVWTAATHTEVYSTNLLFLVLMLLAACSLAAGGGLTAACLGGLAYGLSAGNHGSVALFLPGLALIFFACARPRGRAFLAASALFLLGFSVYCYLPLRSMANPSIDWGDPQTLTRFLSHLTDRKDAGDHFWALQSPGNFYYSARIFLFDTTPRLFYLAGLPLVVLGFARLAAKRLALALGLAWVAGVNIVFFIHWRDTQAFLPALGVAVFCWGLGLAVGLRWLGLRLGRPRRPGLVFAFVLAFSVLVLGLALYGPGFKARDRSGRWLAQEAFLADFETLPPQALVVSVVLWFHHRAFQDVLAVRPDITALALGDFLQPRRMSRVSQQRFPLIALPKGGYEDVAGGLAWLNQLIRLNLEAGRVVVVEPSPNDHIFASPVTAPHGLLVQRGGLGRALQAAPSVEQTLFYTRDGGGLDQDHDADGYFIRLLKHQAQALAAAGRSDEALGRFELAELVLGPGGKKTREFREMDDLINQHARLLIGLDRPREALVYLDYLAAATRGFAAPHVSRGLALYKLGRRMEAQRALESALAIDPAQHEALFGLGLIRAQAKDYRAATRYIRQAAARAPDPATRRRYESYLGGNK